MDEADTPAAPAAAPTDRQPRLEIEAISPAFGLLPGLLQPSLTIRLRAETLEPVAPALLRPIFGDQPLRDHPDIIRQMAEIMTAMLVHHRLPIVSGPQIAALARPRWLIRLPVLQGLHALLARLCLTVTSLLDHISRNQPIPGELMNNLEGETYLLSAQAPSGKNLRSSWPRRRRPEFRGRG